LLFVDFLFNSTSIKIHFLITWNKFCSQSGMIKNEKYNSVHKMNFKSTFLRNNASEAFS